ncbi:MerR family transcriptional regulator [Pseudothauera nasutitermitis]|uniref:Mercuric resistance operon regulatory protein n=1 Tax=Pseudothauera nasutitermitis TaxID=2565930 RepID=A0A4S4B4H0_9RHOO|nr:MerR family DNA-binding protein [Pseudothauera nasutitermitis]THF65824.1 MerR family transcriptional regulator [Pseudothauera nasutitermitis]
MKPAIPTPTAGLTIGRLAAAAGVGVETVRYYQRRGLIGAPVRHKGAFGLYGDDTLQRLRFIRRAQTLGFSLEEIDGLLALDEERDRDKARALAQAKIADIEARLRQLEDVRGALLGLVHCCEHSSAPAPCPILQALGEGPGSADHPVPQHAAQ